MPKYDLSDPKAISLAAEQASKDAANEPSQGSYNAAWLHGYAYALKEAAVQLEPLSRLTNDLLNYLAEHHDSSELYHMLHEDLGFTDDEVSILGFDLDHPGAAENTYGEISEGDMGKGSSNPKTNTKICYLYRDADNYKVHNECIINGILSKEQQGIILGCLDEGEYFIPNKVGLPERRFVHFNPDVDHSWFELSECDFEETAESPTVPISADELVNAFCMCKGKWEEISRKEVFPDKPAPLADQLRAAEAKAAEFHPAPDAKGKEPEPEH